MNSRSKPLSFQPTGNLYQPVGNYTTGSMIIPTNFGTTMSYNLGGSYIVTSKTEEEIIAECVKTRVRLLPFIFEAEGMDANIKYFELDLQNRLLYETEETTILGNEYCDSLRKGPQINQLRYIENNTFATFCTLLGLFQTKESENRVIGALLNKKAEELLQKD